jgi:hypothetical protein
MTGACSRASGCAKHCFCCPRENDSTMVWKLCHRLTTVHSSVNRRRPKLHRSHTCRHVVLWIATTRGRVGTLGGRKSTLIYIYIYIYTHTCAIRMFYCSLKKFYWFTQRISSCCIYKLFLSCYKRRSLML